MAKVRIPYCRVFPDEPKRCNPDGTMLLGLHVPGFVLGRADCTGADELRQTFTYSRFRCRVVARYAPNVQADVAVYPTGPASFRWKVLDAVELS